MLVARTTLRRSAGRRARSCSSRRQRAVQRAGPARPRRSASGPRAPAGPADLLGAGQEDEHVARVLRAASHGPRHGRGDAVGQGGVLGGAGTRSRPGTSAPRPGGSGQPPRNRATGSASSVADMTTRIRSSRTASRTSRSKAEGEVGVQAPLVELVEHDGADAFEERVGQQLPGEDALGHDPEPRPRPDPALEPDLVADLLAERPAVLLGDPRRRRPARRPAAAGADDQGRMLRPQQPRLQRSPAAPASSCPPPAGRPGPGRRCRRSASTTSGSSGSIGSGSMAGPGRPTAPGTFRGAGISG